MDPDLTGMCATCTGSLEAGNSKRGRENGSQPAPAVAKKQAVSSPSLDGKHSEDAHVSLCFMSESTQQPRALSSPSPFHSGIISAVCSGRTTPL